MSLGLGGKVQAENLNVGIIRMWMGFKAVRSDGITKKKNEDGEEKKFRG